MVKKAKAVEVAAPTVEVAVVPAEPTPAELRAQIDAALNSGDYIQAGKLTAILGKGQIAAVKAAEDTRQKALAALTEKVKIALRTEVELLLEEGELDGVDGVWFSVDFAEMVNGQHLANCRLVKSLKGTPVKRTGGGGGAPMKYGISSEDMLIKYGSKPSREPLPLPKKVDWKEGDRVEYDEPPTIQQAYDASSEKNSRYGLRKKMLKLEGLL